MTLSVVDDENDRGASFERVMQGILTATVETSVYVLDWVMLAGLVGWENCLHQSTEDAAQTDGRGVAEITTENVREAIWK